MTPDTNPKQKICPTCGTKLTENATRCLVCGRQITPDPKSNDKKAGHEVKGPRLPEVTLSLPILVALVLVLLAVGAGVVYAVLEGTGQVVEPTATITPSLTPTITVTPTITLTPSPVPSFTPLPPLEYTIQSGDDCYSIAFTFGISVASLIQFNNLPVACDTLIIGNKLLIPQPTLTPSPQPSRTLSAADATDTACEKISYKVVSGDTLYGIASNYNVSEEAIKVYNGMTSDTVYEGLNLIIPLCERLPTAGPSPTPTNPPPYQAPNLLLPADGAVFTAADDTITLQWASVGTLRQNEAYALTVEDLTEGLGKKLIDYVTDTKYILPETFRPTDTIPHVLRWYIVTVRQVGTSIDGQPIYESAGAASLSRVLVWWQATTLEATSTP
jgi:LysM repeat protein